MPEDKKPTAGRSPDFNVSCLNKDTNERAKVGVAWKNTNGCINIRLDPFITLTAGKNILVMLFPVTTEYIPPKKERTAADAFDDFESGATPDNF